MILKIKKIIRLMLIHYYQVVRLETGFRVNYLPLIFFILLISLSSFFIRINFINDINNKFLLNTLLFLGLCNIIFLQFNFGCRLTITLGKGIPYFIREIKRSKIFILYYYFMGKIIYNLSLLILTFFVLIRLYSYINNYNPLLFNIIFIYSMCISIILYFIYMEFNFNKYTYDIDQRKKYTFRLIHIILLAIYPLLLIINLFSYLPKLYLFETILCDPGDSVNNNNNINNQINDNVQETFLSTNGKNNNGQGNKNTQISNNNQHDSNTNIQSNNNQQINTPYRVSNLDIKYYVIDKIKNKYLCSSFWENIMYLENLRGKCMCSNDYINERIHFTICAANDQSKFNRMIFTDRNNKSLQALLFPDILYARFRQLPVLFNNRYEIYDIYINNKKLCFNKIYTSI